MYNNSKEPSQKNNHLCLYENSLTSSRIYLEVTFLHSQVLVDFVH